MINSYSQSTYSQPFLNNNSGIEISLNTYCAITCKNVSMLSIGIRMNDGYWGWIKLHRPLNSIWLDPEIELLQQISNQISLAIFYKTLIEENIEKDIQIKAETIANKTKAQILANTSHVDKIVIYVSIKSKKGINNKDSNIYSQTIKKDCLLIELHNTGNRYQDRIEHGLSICKHLVTINGGEFKTKSQLGKGSKFWFTWNIDLLPSNTIFSSQ
ncbi:protein-histidine kinase [Gigaspora margarita]|uniref:Protein-histidine kinase n=1 Tax=Gigaspora margarita TaxID=4874 RepID=A0A8H3XEC4_GIGMA|nr:protein-histidine kinase [Gigaspora margarita]